MSKTKQHEYKITVRLYLSPEGCDVDYLYREDYRLVRPKHIFDPILIIDEENDSFRTFPNTIYHLFMKEDLSIRFDSLYMDSFDYDIDILVNIPFHHTSQISEVIKQIDQYFKSKRSPIRNENISIEYVI